MAEEFTKGLGWLRDYPDFRDYTGENAQVSPKLQALGQQSIKDMLQAIGVGVTDAVQAKLNPTVDLRPWCSPIVDQQALGSCTANAGVGMVEYFERRAFGQYLGASRLFLYKVSRNLLRWTGDTGAYLRTTMGALTLFGAPPEVYWPYNIADFDKEPTSFCYAFAQNFQALTYYRLDPPSMPVNGLLMRIKQYLTAGLPAMFGFTVYSSISQADSTGRIPIPVAGEKVVGGHAVLAVGYDDQIQIQNATPNAPVYPGALLIRNSWGTGWGESGYGWLPYEYVLRALAVDWWSMLKAEWIGTGQFGL